MKKLTLLATIFFGFKAAALSNSLTDPKFTIFFDASAPKQDYVIGSKALYRLNVKDWRPYLETAHRGAEVYGGPRWSVSYGIDTPGAQISTLAFRKEGNARLGIHPEYLLSSLADDNLAVEHKLVPHGFKMDDMIKVRNKSRYPLRIWHYEVFDLYMHPKVAKPLPNMFTKPIPGQDIIHEHAERSLMKEDPATIEQGVRIKYSYPEIARPKRRKIRQKNKYPASVEIKFYEADEIFSLFEPMENPGSDEYMRRESLPALLGDSEVYGPVYVGRKEFLLQPGESKELHASMELILGDGVEVDADKLANMPMANLDAAFPNTPPKDSGIEPERWNKLRFEMMTKVHQMKALATWDEITGKVAITQGAYYFDVFGLHTSLRDFINALVGVAEYVPDLAKEAIEYCMQLQGAKDSFFPYAWSGVMNVDENSGIRPDLGPTLIWGIVEVMKAKPNWDWFFKSEQPFYPPTDTNIPDGAHGTSPYDHIKAAFTYLDKVVGLGNNNIPKCHSGDWSDSLLTLAGPLRLDKPFESLAFINSKAHGESPMVGQMAVVVLNDLASLLRSAPIAEPKRKQEVIKFVNKLDNYVAGVKTALQKIYAQNKAKGNPFFPRALLRDKENKEIWVLDEQVDLAGQVWALMATDKKIEILSAAERNDLIDLITKDLMTRIGVRTVKPPVGATADYFRLQGRPWSVISQWFTKALGDNDRTLEAWNHLWLTSLSNHNTIFMNRNADGSLASQLVSGFDGWNPDGMAWYLRPLPMNKARWNNANHPGMFLWATQHLLGK